MDTFTRSLHFDYISGDSFLVRRNTKPTSIGDLHMHTSYSDGYFSPEEVVRKAEERGLAALSITDHDSVNGIDEAIEAGLSHGIDVIPGIELSSMYGDREIHVLGYFIDHHDKDLRDYLKIFRRERVKRAREMVRRLNDLKIPVTIDTILDNAEGRSVGRPHIAAAVLATGHVKSYLEVFHKYIGFGCPAYVAKYRLDIQDAVAMISRAGGLSFIAHPSNELYDTVLYDIIKSGIDGIETIHPSLNKQKTKYFRGIAHEYYLLESGGSDFHGGKRGDDDHIGRYGVPMYYIDAMRKRLVA
jgi:3',5'-nucleoside bisphosphate phosphatase